MESFFELLLKLNWASLAVVATFIGFFFTGVCIFIWRIENYFSKRIKKSSAAIAKNLAEFEKTEEFLVFLKEGPVRITFLENSLSKAEKIIAELKHENSSLLKEKTCLELKTYFLQNPLLIKELLQTSPLTEET